MASKDGWIREELGSYYLPGEVSFRVERVRSGWELTAFEHGSYADGTPWSKVAHTDRTRTLTDAKRIAASFLRGRALSDGAK